MTQNMVHMVLSKAQWYRQVSFLTMERGAQDKGKEKKINAKEKKGQQFLRLFEERVDLLISFSV